MNQREVVYRIARAYAERWPMLPAERALQMAEVAFEVVDTPHRIGSGLDLCRVCRAPRRLEARAR